MCSEYRPIGLSVWRLKVTVTVDGSDFPKTLNSDLQLMSGRHLLVGGSQNTTDITARVMRNNFYGTIDKVSYVLRLRLLWRIVVHSLSQLSSHH